MAASNESRVFDDLRSALLEFPPLKDERSVWPEIQEIVDRLAEVMGDVVSAHIPAKESYIGVHFRNASDQVGAYVHKGFIDHLEKLNSKVKAYADKPYWRTFLSTAGPSNTKATETPLKEYTCSTCFQRVTKYATCSCGWSPSSSL